MSPKALWSLIVSRIVEHHPVGPSTAAAEVSAKAMSQGSSGLRSVVAKVKPRYRGIPDCIAVFIAIPAAYMLVHAARVGIDTTAAAIYGISMVLMWSVSATYHTFMWPTQVRMILRRIDHSMVFMLIAGSYTPVCLSAVSPAEGGTILGLVWLVAAIGIAKCFLFPNAPRSLNTTLYLGLGWLVMPLYGNIKTELGIQGVVLLLVGGAMFSIGAVIYWWRWPNPSPRVFGYHEVFHVFVAAGLSFHYAMMWRLLTPG